MKDIDVQRAYALGCVRAIDQAIDFADKLDADTLLEDALSRLTHSLSQAIHAAIELNAYAIEQCEKARTQAPRKP